MRFGAAQRCALLCARCTVFRKMSSQFDSYRSDQCVFETDRFCCDAILKCNVRVCDIKEKVAYIFVSLLVSSVGSQYGRCNLIYLKLNRVVLNSYSYV